MGQNTSMALGRGRSPQDCGNKVHMVYMIALCKVIRHQVLDKVTLGRSLRTPRNSCGRPAVPRNIGDALWRCKFIDLYNIDTKRFPFVVMEFLDDCSDLNFN